MDAEIIPAVNEEVWDLVEERIRKVEPYAEWVHLDVADGTFTPNKLWENPLDLKNFKTPLKIEVHLMMKHPELEISDWISAGVKRVIVHAEALTASVFHAIEPPRQDAGVQLIISITPESSWRVLQLYSGRENVGFQVLAVHPGLAGQSLIEGGGGGAFPYLESSYEKISRLRALCPTCDIEVDGGVKLGIAKKCREAGANLFAISSAIFSAPDIGEAIKAFKQDVA